MGFFNTVKRKVVFFAGDLHKLHAFPWLTWSIHRHQVDLGEVQEVMSGIKHGDIGLHRDWGYLSNLFIPGFMKHGWIHVEDNSLNNPMVVEAISEGVVCRSSYYPMYSDYTIILSPKGVTDKDRKGACSKAKRIVGVKYDHDFNFEIDKELEYYQGTDKERAKKDLEYGKEHLNTGFDKTFSCTEVCAYSWWHQKETLNIKHKDYKTFYGKKMQIITADDFVNSGWEIKWMSESVNADIAKKLKAPEEAIQLIADYRQKNKAVKRTWINYEGSGCLRKVKKMVLPRDQPNNERTHEEGQ